ncbi:MAG: FAD-binding protein [Clostridia bacterium]|nr:FAD-binding protein [Clostridia bacterium]
MNNDKTVNVVGAGLSGLSAAITLAKNRVKCNLISVQPSERAQSVLAEGGINAALDTMGENDTTEEHFADTMRGGVFLESESAVRNLTENAPAVVRELVRIGVPFQSKNGDLILRNFGGQAKKRTAYAKSSTGKIIMTALIDEARRYEASGLIRRYPHHELSGVNVSDGALSSIHVIDRYSKECLSFEGVTILCTGGLNGFFEGMTTGTTLNTGNAASLAFTAGVAFANLEFIQYHPTTVQICDKRMLISEAARGEGGRLFILRDNAPWYFMEEKYPQLGNLMPRDVVSREIVAVKQDPKCMGEVYLDMTGLHESVWSGKLSDLREEIISYLHLDPKTEPVPVSPGIHFFMGGIRVNDRHETNISGLLAAGEAACKYHGANRLGGNSMLGAIFGGQTAAQAAMQNARNAVVSSVRSVAEESSPAQRAKLREILLGGLGIIRTTEEMTKAYNEILKICEQKGISGIDRARAMLGLAMLGSAIERRESRGAHYRTDYPKPDDAYKKQSVAQYVDGKLRLSFDSADIRYGGDDL